MKIIATATPGGFQPQPEYFDEYEEKIHIGQDYMIDVTQPRNLGHHRKWFALTKTIFEIQDKYETMKDVIVELKLRCGLYSEHISCKGVLMYIPESISFSSMGQIEFEEFYNKTINVALKYLIPDMEKEELENCVNVILQFG